MGCDAVQVYRELDVATAKPSRDARARVRHHLVDAVDPRLDYSLADYVRDATAAIAEISGRGRAPIVVGGTGMYLRGLLRGIVEAPARDPRLRDRLRAIAARRGPSALHRRLRGVDPASAARIPPSDTQRIVRAFEVAIATGVPWSETLRRNGTWEAERDIWAALKIGLDLPRDLLARRLDERVGVFFGAGLVDEVRRLLEAGIPPEANAFKAIGYREVLEALRASRDLAAVPDLVRRNTRRYAKRQRTWFRKEPDVVWLGAEERTDVLADRVVALWRGGAG